MAFLDNSGDIILDAVLTDTGRMRLAKGDGSFRITQFALGDDEINYALYDKNNANGTAYYDLNILQTPIFEAFTNNISSMNSRLMSISRNNLLYLPILKVNDRGTGNKYAVSSIVNGGFILLADPSTSTAIPNTAAYNNLTVGSSGIIQSDGTKAAIRIDQGIDNINFPPTYNIDDLRETQYLLEIDNRIATVCTIGDKTAATVSYIDDDNIAGYYLSSDVDNRFVNNLDSTPYTDNGTHIIKGARGTSLEFSLKASQDILSSRYLFDQLGTDVSSKFSGLASGTVIKSIVTNITVTGLTTGCSLQIPLVVFKKI